MNCDRIARAYRWLEFASFGRALQRRREAFLAEIAAARRVLLLGDGDGRFLAALLRRNPRATVDSVDGSARMLALARRRVESLARQPQVCFHPADALTWRPPAGTKYDLIVTHFFLDCFAAEELARLIPAVAEMAAPGARWLISEFRQPPGNGLAAWRARLWIVGLYAAFRWTTGLQVRDLPDYASLLAAQGFRLERQSLSEWGLLTSELWRIDPIP